jgi:CRISPR/Cas system type I-B associated protein Csh2 (Cas7 group RAMP superfamily)
MDNNSNQTNSPQNIQAQDKSTEKLNDIFKVADEAYADAVKSAEDLQAMEIQFKEIEKEYEELEKQNGGLPKTWCLTIRLLRN